MMLPMMSIRPTCEQLLNNKNLWALSMSDIQNDLMFEKLKNLSISESSMKNNFCSYFIKFKSIKTLIRAEVSYDFITEIQKQSLENQTSRHLKTSENLNLNVNLQNLENNKYEKQFEEKDLIGCGSFGIVYKAIKRSNGKVYAIKKIALNDEDIEKVSKELKIITKLKCDYVAEFITFWVEDNYIKAGVSIRDNKDESISSGPSF